MFEVKYSDKQVYEVAKDKADGMSMEDICKKHNLTENQVDYIIYQRLKKENEERGLEPDAVVTVVDSSPENISVSASVSVGSVTATGQTEKQPEVPAPPPSLFRKLFGWLLGK